MAHLGGVSRKGDLFFAKVDTQESGVRYKMEGPLRSDEQEAFEDLHYIRSCSEGELNLNNLYGLTIPSDQQ